MILFSTLLKILKLIYFIKKSKLSLYLSSSAFTTRCKLLSSSETKKYKLYLYESFGGTNESFLI